MTGNSHIIVTPAKAGVRQTGNIPLVANLPDARLRGHDEWRDAQ